MGLPPARNSMPGMAAFALLLAAVAASPARATTIPPGYQADLITNGILGPIALAFTPDDRVLVTQRFGGQVRMIKDGVLLDRPVADFNTNTCRERGLIGIALDPAFDQNGWVYVFLSQSSIEGKDTALRDSILDNRIVRFTLDADTMLAGSDVVIKRLYTDPSLCAHISGNIHFLPDSTLLVSYGDSEADPSPALDISVLRGKFLRLNRFNGDAMNDNPYADDNDPDTRGEIWAKGVRNSFDFTVDRMTGTVFATENSDWYDDEINVIVKDGDYGFPAVVGPADTPEEQAYALDHLAHYREPIWASGVPTVCATGVVALDSLRWDGDLGHSLLFAECNEPYRIRRLPLDESGLAAAGPAEDWASFDGSVIDLDFDHAEGLWVTVFNEVWRIRKIEPASVPPGADGLMLAHAGAHPALGDVRLRWQAPAGQVARITVRDVRGRLVRDLSPDQAANGMPQDVRWDRRDVQGAAVPPGMYFVRLAEGNATRTLPVLVVR